MVDQITQTFETIKIILLYGWPFILLIGIMILKFRWKNWPVEAVIIEKRGNNLIKTNDRAGKYYDPYSQIIGYKLLKSKDTLPVVNYDWVLYNVSIATTFFERFVNILRGNIGTIFLFRYGSKQYKPIIVRENNQRKLIWKLIKNNDGSAKLINIYEQFDPRNHIGKLDFEVVDWDNINFMVQEQRASILRRQKKGEFWKQVLIPLAMIIVAALVCIIMIKFSYDYATHAWNSAGSTVTEQQPATKPDIPVISNLIPGK